MAQTTRQPLSAIGVAGQAGPVLKLWCRLQTMRQDGIDMLANKREQAAAAALQEVSRDTFRLEQQLAALQDLMADEQKRSQKMLIELSSLKNTTMQVAADAPAAAEGSHTSSDDMESDEDWRDHEYTSTSDYAADMAAAAAASQPLSTGTSSTYSSDSLSSPTARSDWASEDGEHVGELEGQMQQTTAREMEDRMIDGTKLEDPIQINELLLQSLSFGDELNDARVTLQARYAELVREQAMREAGGVKDLSNY